MAATAAPPLSLWRNTVTLIGAALSAISILFILSFLFFDLLSAHPSPYLGLFTFMILPGLLAIGAVMMVSGVVVARWRYRVGKKAPTKGHFYPRINLNLPQHRRVLMITMAVIAVSLPIIGVLSYEGYHYTDSNEFCGLVCHQVMEPQYAAYLQSPHARVNCAECHIGSGATWYVKSKLSGVRQVLAVANNSYSRPIPPAIHDLRPATDTCRECHWPSKFYGDQLVTLDNFASDSDNTHSQLRMLLKTGGSDKSTGPPSGIHWHMTLGFTIEYVATDEYLQEIPWVRTVDGETGEEHIYRSDGKSTDDPPPEGIRRVVDCMDCHNRPTHIFRSPDNSVDVALNVDPSLQSLPFAKREAVNALVRPYASKAEGEAGVVEAISQFYKEQQPDIWNTRKADVEHLEQAVSKIYHSNYFPEMNVNWRTYPNNIGHKIFPGCFRCHEGRHVNDAGATISHECSICHEFLTPRGGGDDSSLIQTGEFIHPFELEGSHATMRCDRCHTGGVAPSKSCEGCHSTQNEFRAGTLSAFSAFNISPDPMLDAVGCDGCHELSEPTNIETIDAVCMDCHDDEEERFEGMLAAWKQEVDQLLSDAETRTDEEGRKLLEALRLAGPLHNIEATRLVVRSLTGESEPPAKP